MGSYKTRLAVFLQRVDKLPVDKLGSLRVVYVDKLGSLSSASTQYRLLGQSAGQAFFLFTFKKWQEDEKVGMQRAMQGHLRICTINPS